MKKLISFLFLAFIAILNHQAQNYSFVYDASGNRTDRLIILTKSTAFSNINDSASLESMKELINDVTTIIYPNPTKDDVYVRFLNYDKLMSSKLLIYDNTGKLLRTVVNYDNEITVGLSQFPVGNYYLIININGETSRWNIIKQ